MFSQFKDFRYQNFKQLKNDCIKADNLFNDGLFGADHLCLDINGTMQNREVQWLRPRDVYPDPKLGFGGPIRGKFSSSAVAAALAAACSRLAIKDHLIPPDQEWNSEKPLNYRGIFHFHFHYFGQWTDVVVDDRLPTQKHKLVYMGAEHENEFWPSLVEKAYAKLHGGYNVISRIPVTDVLSDLTGGVCEIMDLAQMTSENTSAAEEWVEFYNMLEEAFANNSLFIATKSTGEEASTNEEGEEEVGAFSTNGIKENGLYAIAEIKKLNVGTMFKRDYVHVLKLISPVEQCYTGPYSPESRELAALPDSAKKDMKCSSPRHFWMSVGDFFEEFTHLVVNHVVSNSLLQRGKAWKKEQFRSWWGDGKAGGYNSDKAMFIRCNHQYIMEVNDEDMILLIELTQKPQYTGAVSSANPFDDGSMPAFKRIGFAILQIEINREFRLHRTHYETVRVSQFEGSRSVCIRTNLPEGRYCVIPCTYDSNTSGEFVLRFFSTKSLNVRQVTEEMPTRHWMIKCFVKPYLAGMSLTVIGLQMIEGILDNPEALDSLSGSELFVQLLCEKDAVVTSHKRAVSWNEQFSIYLRSPVTATLTAKVFKKNVIGSSLIGISTIPLQELFGSPKTLDDTRDKEFDLRLRDKNNVNMEIHLRMKISFYSDLMDM